MRALGAVLCQDRDASQPLAIGSVKTNIGHAEAAAGAAGLIKVVLALQHAEIPPHLHFEQPNPYIAWDELPIVVPTHLMPWLPIGGRRIAGVSSFGLSGTNAHVIVEEAPARMPVPAGIERPLHVLSMSAHSANALQALSRRMAQYLEAHAAGSFADMCHSANSGRSHFAHRLALVAASPAQARDQLAAYHADSNPAGVFSAHAPGGRQLQVAFLFTGHGSLYAGMGRQLYDTQPTFRGAIDECARLLRPDLDRPLASVLYPEPGASATGAPSPLDEMAYAQPAIFALEYALAVLWRSWGIAPAAVLGHSLGEYAAACVAGVFSLEDSLKMVAARGRLMQSLPTDGEMVTVFAGEAAVAPAVAPYAAEVSIAAINSPETVVISGSRAAVQKVVAALKENGIKSRALPISHAAHSPLVDPLLGVLNKVAMDVAYSPPQAAYVSGMSGQLAAAGEVARPDYWRRHLREPVRFAQAMQTLHDQGYRVFVEIGPNTTLLSLGQRCIPAEPGLWLPSLREGRGDWTQMLESLAALYAHGATVDWAGFERDYARARRRVALPAYPWERKSHWLERESRTRRATQFLEPQRWDTIVSAGHRQAQQAPLDLAVHTFPARWQSLERLSVAYITAALRALNVFSAAGERQHVSELLAQCKISSTYYSLLGCWLRRLAGQGLLQAEADGSFVSVQALPAPPLDALRAETREVLADTPFLFDYVDYCGQHLVAILTGLESPLDTLFPGGSFERAEALYQDWALSRYCNGIVSAVVQSALHTMSATQPIRILEVGAGTGATTAALLPVLPAERANYTFTDVSNLFLDRASRKFCAYPFVRYGLLDIERDPQAQGFPAAGCDVIVAANVLHATRDLAEALRHVGSLLTAGGLLVLCEVTHHFAWHDITTGLIEGWQRFGDDLRSDQPLLSLEQWQTALRSAGFDAVAVFPESGSATEVLGQHVIVARAPARIKSAAGSAAQPVSWEAQGTQTHTRPAPANDAQQTGQAGAIAPASEGDLLRQLSEALPSEREDVLVEYVRKHVARILRFGPTDSLDRHMRLMDAGIDSLMAVELRNALGRGLALPQPLPATLIFDYPSIQAIAAYLAHEVLVPGKTISEIGQRADGEAAAPRPADVSRRHEC